MRQKRRLKPSFIGGSINVAPLVQNVFQKKKKIAESGLFGLRNPEPASVCATVLASETCGSPGCQQESKRTV